MPVKKVTQDGKEAIYFCTFTCLDWLPLFEKTNLYDRIYSCFDVLKKKESPVLGYVIMPNHLHFMFYLSRECQSLNTTVGEMKRFLAYDLVKYLKKLEENELLLSLARAVRWYDKKKGKQHECFEDSFDWKLCESEEFILQKLNYMHHNPVSGKWKLADDFVNYPHSSARFYETGVQSLYEVTHYREVYG